MDLNKEWSRVEVKIFNMMGEEVKQYLIAEKTRKVQVDLRGFSKGIYHLQLRSGNNIVNKKIIVQ